MIRTTAASLALTAVAAATAVYLVGMIDPATEIVCRPAAGTLSSTAPGTTDSDGTSLMSSLSSMSTSASTPSPSGAASAGTTADPRKAGGLASPPSSDRVSHPRPDSRQRATTSTAVGFSSAQTTSAAPTPTTSTDVTTSSAEAREICLPADELPETGKS